MSEDDQDVIVVGAALPGGDDWDFTPRAADGLDAANLEIIGEPAEPPADTNDGEDEEDEEDGSGEED